MYMTCQITINIFYSIRYCMKKHKKCPISVNYYFCLLDLPVTRSMLKCLSVMWICQFPCISHSTYLFYIFWSYCRYIDSWFVVECSFICFLKFAFLSMLFILNSILSAIKYFTPAFGNFTFLNRKCMCTV